MSNCFDTLSLLILFSSFILMANKRIDAYIRTFRVQSMLIALTAGIMGVTSSFDEGRVDILVVCLLIIILKVILIPNMLSKTYANVKYKVEKDFFLNIPILILVCCVLVVLAYFSISTTINSSIINARVVNSVSVILIGLFFMISRKKALGQIVGFLVIENGLYVTALFSTHGMPFIVDVGIFIDILTAVVIMGFMVFRIDKKFASIDIEKLNRLRG